MLASAAASASQQQLDTHPLLVCRMPGAFGSSALTAGLHSRCMAALRALLHRRRSATAAEHQP
jgi:hypothetical protein